MHLIKKQKMILYIEMIQTGIVNLDGLRMIHVQQMILEIIDVKTTEVMFGEKESV